MTYEEKLSKVLEIAALATPESLDQLYSKSVLLPKIDNADKIKTDRAALCAYIPYLNANDTELLCTSARMCREQA